MSLDIRDAVPADAPQLAQWAQAMAWETEQKTLPAETVLAGVVNGMASPERARYFVAEVSGVAVATLMLTTEWSDWRNGQWWWIQSVYVEPAYRRQGLYRALYRHILALAKADTGVCGVRLYVEKDNAVAQQTYTALGMQDAHYRVFEQALPRP